MKRRAQIGTPHFVRSLLTRFILEIEEKISRCRFRSRQTEIQSTVAALERRHGFRARRAGRDAAALRPIARTRSQTCAPTKSALPSLCSAPEKTMASTLRQVANVDSDAITSSLRARSDACSIRVLSRVSDTRFDRRAIDASRRRRRRRWVVDLNVAKQQSRDGRSSNYRAPLFRSAVTGSACRPSPRSSRPTCSSTADRRASHRPSQARPAGPAGPSAPVCRTLRRCPREMSRE